MATEPGPQLVRRMIEDSKHLSELEAKLKTEGVSFKTGKQLSDYLFEMWKKTYISPNPDILAFEPKPIAEVPYLTVDKEGIRYFVHGFSHGEPGRLKPSPELIGLVNQSAASHVSDRSDYMFEQGLDHFYTLEKSKCFNDVTYVAGVAPRIALKGFFSTFKAAARQMVFGIPEAKEGKSLDLMTDFKTLCSRSLYDVRYMPLLSEFYFKWMEVQQPLDMELNLSYDESFQLHTMRSIFMAERAKAEAKGRNLAEMHIYNGLYHSSQVAFALQHKLKLREPDAGDDKPSVPQGN